jgi:hypothetical protein
MTDRLRRRRRNAHRLASITAAAALAGAVPLLGVPAASFACPYHQQSALAEPDAPLRQLAQAGAPTGGPANRANEQQGTVSGSPPPSSSMATGGSSSATTGPANRANEQQGTVQGQQYAPSSPSSGSSSMPPGTAPTGGPANRANEQQGTVK